MKSFLGRVLLVTAVTCALSILAFAIGYGFKFDSVDGDSHGARHEAVSPVDLSSPPSLSPGPQQAVLDQGKPESRSEAAAQAGDALRLAKLSASPGTLSIEQSSRLPAKGRDDTTGELFRPSTILTFLLILLALIGLRRNPTDR